MVIDIPAEVINESIKRQIGQAMDKLVVEELPDCPIWRFMSLEQVKRLIAISIVMMRTLQSAARN